MWFKRTELTSAKPQLACASMKHNTSVIKLPDARTRADAKVVIFASNVDLPRFHGRFKGS